MGTRYSDTRQDSSRSSYGHSIFRDTITSRSCYGHSIFTGTITSRSCYGHLIYRDTVYSLLNDTISRKSRYGTGCLKVTQPAGAVMDSGC